MAFVKTPSVWIPSWSEDGTTISVPIASFPQLSVAEADGTTGDIRNITHAFLETLWDRWRTLAEADRPKKLTIAKTTNVNTSTEEVTHQYVVTVKASVLTEEVAAEPT